MQRNTVLISVAIVVVGVVATSLYALSRYQEVSTQNNFGTITNTAMTSNISEKTTEWKTYSNTEYGFELKYPNYYNPFQDTNLASNLGGIYLEKAPQGGFQIGYKTKITALTSVRAESQRKNIGEFRINVYNLNSYRISNVPAGIEFGFDSDKNLWWQDRGEGKSTSSLLPKIKVGNDLVGYKIGIGDAGEGFEYVLIPMVAKKMMIEILFYQGISAPQGAPIDTILSTFKLI